MAIDVCWEGDMLFCVKRCQDLTNNVKFGVHVNKSDSCANTIRFRCTGECEAM